MKKTIPALFIFFVLLSCKKTITKTEYVPTPVEHSWSYDSSIFGYARLILTASTLDDSSLAIASKQAVYTINAKQLNAGINGSYLPYSAYGSLVPPTISGTTGVYPFDSNHLLIFSVVDPVSNYGKTSFTPVYSSSPTSTKGLPLANIGSGYAVINNTYILAPFEIDFANETATCSLIKIAPVQGYDNSIQVVSSKDIQLQPAQNTLGFEYGGGYESYAYKGKFFLNFYGQFYRIDTTGKVKVFGNNPVPGSKGYIAKMFSLGGYLFAISTNDFLVSADDGETWSLFTSFSSSGSPYLSLSYQQVGDEVFAYQQSQIWQVTLDGNSLNFKELDNDGLEYSVITSINKTGGHAFVSTLSGLYYRDTASLYTYKK